jgi:hypothetical protein
VPAKIFIGRPSSSLGGVLDPDKGGVGEMACWTLITGVGDSPAEGGAEFGWTGAGELVSSVVSMTIVDPYFPNFPE